ncbi:hypothetical protein [Methylobacterium frigidaeris]|uniref:Uncharacterized protein n=1 Tax=Methylobacterium frigidaeris TaxID=2038277 RepID=A0AA37HGQ0_9HYPH|nr:hypothetical protein [Methylobacterium frigidaeris]GJD65211.1 hypothetical protein MPEAHAMD_5398 [Methylobacterium frigidaeris]
MIHLTAPDRELEALSAIQAARYVGGRDIADPAILAVILEENDFAPAAARLRAPDAALHEAATARMAAGPHGRGARGDDPARLARGAGPLGRRRWGRR